MSYRNLCGRLEGAPPVPGRQGRVGRSRRGYDGASWYMKTTGAIRPAAP